MIRRKRGIGQRIGTQIGTVASAAGVRLDDAISYALEKTDDVKGSMQQLCGRSWSGFTGNITKTPYISLLVGAGVGYLLARFISRNG
jgi:hypothetical protein